MDVPNFERAEYVTPYAADREPAPSPPEPFDKAAFRRALVHGLVGAVGGCAIYAIVGLWLELGLISIIVGAMVGSMMMKGSDGIGGRPYQIAAVIMTYFAVSTSYVLTATMHAMGKGQDPMDYVAKHAAISLAIVLFGPFLILFRSLGGVLSLIILFFGMQAAWRITKGGAIPAVAKPYNPDNPLSLR